MPSAVADAAAKIPGVAKVLLADDAAYGNALAENLAKLIVSLAPNYSHVLAADHRERQERDAARRRVARRAADLGDQQRSRAPTPSMRSIYAGNAMATVQSSDKIKIITVRGTAFRGRRRHRRLGRDRERGAAATPALPALSARSCPSRSVRNSPRRASSSPAAAACSPATISTCWRRSQTS
jgi:electron transfer flavoprotein alpha subunit